MEGAFENVSNILMMAFERLYFVVNRILLLISRNRDLLKLSGQKRCQRAGTDDTNARWVGRAGLPKVQYCPRLGVAFSRNSLLVFYCRYWFATQVRRSERKDSPSNAFWLSLAPVRWELASYGDVHLWPR